MPPATAAAADTIDSGSMAVANVFVGGMHCAACSELIERTLAQTPGVADAAVDPLTHRLGVRFDVSRLSLEQILATVTELGYDPEVVAADDSRNHEQDEQRAAIKRLVVASIGMMQVMMFAIGLYAGDAQGIDARMEYFLRLVSLTVATLVVGYAARPFFVGALRGIATRNPGMDLPVALAIGLAYAGSVYSTFTNGSEVWFDSVTMFVFFLSLGRYFEMNARLTANRKAEALKPKLPSDTDVIRDGRRQRIAIAELRVGDTLVVMPGDRVVADGILLSERTSLDESVLTGESVPLVKTEGDEVAAGSINLDTTVHVQVLRTGRDTVLGRIRELTETAQLRRPAFVQLADRVAGYFVIAVLVLAVCVAGFWYQYDASRAFVVTLTVLVITCPCALALAMPTAFAAAHSWISGVGLILKNPDVLPVLADAERIVFDKTGTLTLGTPVIRRVVPHAATEDEALGIAAALEANSRHPLAHAFRDIEAAGEANNVRAEPGQGIEGTLDGQTWRLGTREFATQGRDKDGNRNVCLGRDGELMAEFELDDELRSDAVDVIRQLRDMGIEISLLSGDAEDAVRATAEATQIEDWQGQLLPGDKLERIRRWQKRGERVVMVGDGINDAPVLAGADASIAPAHAADVAQTGADLIMLGEQLKPVVQAVTIARRTHRIIRQNLAWAIVYNLCALPLAVAGLVPTWLAAIGMSTSSLVVVGNSLRLSR